MELIKKNIHMDRIKCQSTAQVTLEEDINVPDNKPDVGGIILHKAVIQIEEVKPTEDHVSVRGRLLFSVLYQTKDEGQMLSISTAKFRLKSSFTWKGCRERMR